MPPTPSHAAVLRCCSSSTSTPCAATRYLLEGVLVVEEYANQGVWRARYVYEDGIDQPGCMDRADQADVNGNQNTTEVLRFHYHQQALGCVTEMTQPTGAVVEWVVYDVYGAATIRDQNGNVVGSSPIGNPYLCTGREFDAESELYFYRARSYDPLTGRFLQRDPLGVEADPNLYLHCRASPVCPTDPMGEDPVDHFAALHQNVKKLADEAKAEFEWAVAECSRLLDLARKAEKQAQAHSDRLRRLDRAVVAADATRQEQLDQAAAAAIRAADGAEKRMETALTKMLAYECVLKKLEYLSTWWPTARELVDPAPPGSIVLPPGPPRRGWGDRSCGPLARGWFRQLLRRVLGPFYPLLFGEDPQDEQWPHNWRWH